MTLALCAGPPKSNSRRWAMADPETKARFEQMAFEDKQRYEREKHEFHMAQRQKELNRPRPIESTSSEPTFQASSSSGSSSQANNSQPSISWNSNPSNSTNPGNPGTSGTPGNNNPLPIVQQNTSPPISQVHPTSPPIHIINHHPTPSPTIRYGY